MSDPYDAFCVRLDIRVPRANLQQTPFLETIPQGYAFDVVRLFIVFLYNLVFPSYVLRIREK